MYIPKPGLGNAANYISSGIPRIINNITVPASGSGAHTEELQQVPRKITIKNTLSSDSASVPILVGFFENCFDANEVLELDNQQTLTGLYRPKNIYLMSNDGASEASASILLESTGINFPTSDFQWFQSESANTRGTGNAASFQISGIPQIFGKRLITETTGFNFGHISRDVTIYNNVPTTQDSAPLRVGFNSASLDEEDGEWFVLENGEAYTGEWKLNSIWLKPHTATETSGSVIVGLTGIKNDLDFNNYSGSTVIASSKSSTLPRFTNYDALYSYLTDQGSSYLRAIPLYSIGSDGDDTNIIGHFGYSGSYIVNLSNIDILRITPPTYGRIASITNGTDIELEEGSTLFDNDIANFVDFSDEANIFEGITLSKSGNTVTIADTTGLAQGDQIYGTYGSEFSWGYNKNISIFRGCILKPSQQGWFFSGNDWATHLEEAKFTFPAGGTTQYILYHDSISLGDQAGAAATDLFDFFAYGKVNINRNYSGFGRHTNGEFCALNIRRATNWNNVSGSFTTSDPDVLFSSVCSLMRHGQIIVSIPVSNGHSMTTAAGYGWWITLDGTSNNLEKPLEIVARNCSLNITAILNH